MDTYEPMDRPVRMIISLDNMTFMFYNEFLRFRKEDITNLYVLLRFLDKIPLENHSTIEHMPGVMNTPVDVFSRLVVKEMTSEVNHVMTLTCTQLRSGT